MKKIRINRRFLFQLLPIFGITAITIAVSLVLYANAMQREEARCWQILQETAQSVSYSIRTKLQDETVKLHMVAELMLLEDKLTPDDLGALHLETLQPTTLFSRIDVLFPDQVIVSADGTQKILSHNIDINEVASYGEYLSCRKTDVQSETECCYYSLPVIRDGEVLAVIVGVLNAESLASSFKIEIYNGQANICIIDCRDGNYIMDSWHTTLGNAYDLPARERLKGYEEVDLKKSIQNQETGVIAFLSQTTGQPLYMYFTPINIFDLQLLIFAQDDIIFENLISLKKILFWEEIIEVLLLSLYFLWNYRAVCQLEIRNHKIQQQRERLHYLGYHDVLTSLYNRNKYEEVIESLRQQTLHKTGVAYIDLNGLKHINDTQSHAAGDQYIRDCAQVISAVFKHNGFRIGGDEFVILVTDTDCRVFLQQIDQLKEEMNAHQVNISIGFSWQESCDKISKLILEAEEMMYTEKKKYHAQYGQREHHSLPENPPIV